MTRNKIFRYLINQSYKNFTFVVIAMAMIFALNVNHAIAQDNLLQNPGAEQGIAYWNAAYGFTTRYTDRWCFYGGDDTDAAETFAYQYVDVSAYAQAIDNEELVAHLSGWIISTHGGDMGALNLLFWDGPGDGRTQLGSTVSTGWQAPGGWTYYSLHNPLPPVCQVTIRNGHRIASPVM